MKASNWYISLKYRQRARRSPENNIHNQVSARGTLDSTLSMSLICLYHTRNVKVCEEFPCDSDVLQFGHELTIKTAHCFTGEEARLFLLEMVVDLA